VVGVGALLVGLLCCAPAWAAEGDLDPSFGSGGAVATPIGATSEGNAMTIDAQGRILVAGRTGEVADVDMAVVRYLPNGSLDSSFSNDGVATFGFPGAGSYDIANSVAIDSAGRIVLGGVVEAPGGNEDFAMIRIAPDGVRDAGFGPAGSNGYVTQPITPGQNDVAEAGAIDSQGRIVLGGWTRNGDDDFAAARFTANGVPDTSFGTGGIKAIDFTPLGGDQDAANAMTIDGQDRIVLAGHSGPFANLDFALVRLNSDGSRDSSFGPNTSPDQQGEVTTPMSPNQDAAYGLTIDAAGRIVVTGYAQNPMDYRFALARYNADGSLDGTFSDDGKLISSFALEARDVAVDAQGRIVTAGFGTAEDKFIVARYFPDGGFDQAFGVGGVAAAPSGGSANGNLAMSFDDHDRIVVAGANLRSDNTTYEFGVARFIGDAVAPPAAAIGSGPPDGALINDPTPTFEFASSEAGAGYACGFDGASAACVSPFTPGTPLADGQHTFAVSAVDRAGNASTAATRTFTVDTHAPKITIKGKKKLETDSGKAREKLKIKTSEGAELTCKVDKKKPKPCHAKFKTKLKLGKHKVTVTATDQAGNSSDEAKKIKVVPKP
jgi:uncharacterized delta-60 repeat protein